MSNKIFLKKKQLDLNIFFCFLSNTVFLNKKTVWTRYTLPLNTFCIDTRVLLKLSTSVVFKFFQNCNQLWLLFWKVVAFNRSLISGFFAEMELIGLGFRIKKIIPGVYRFFWGHANFVYLFAPSTVFVEHLVEERSIFFFSVNLQLLNNIVTHLMLLRKLSVYRVTGFVKPGKIIRLNAGKQR